MFFSYNWKNNIGHQPLPNQPVLGFKVWRGCKVLIDWILCCFWISCFRLFKQSGPSYMKWHVSYVKIDGKAAPQGNPLNTKFPNCRAKHFLDGALWMKETLCFIYLVCMKPDSQRAFLPNQLLSSHIDHHRISYALSCFNICVAQQKLFGISPPRHSITIYPGLTTDTSWPSPIYFEVCCDCVKPKRPESDRGFGKPAWSSRAHMEMKERGSKVALILRWPSLK